VPALGGEKEGSSKNTKIREKTQSLRDYRCELRAFHLKRGKSTKTKGRNGLPLVDLTGVQSEKAVRQRSTDKRIPHRESEREPEGPD